MPASLTFRFARERRRFSVYSGTRNARAISSVRSPPSARSVRATWASSPSDGWQQVKISSSRSSGKVVSSNSSSTASGTSNWRVFSASTRSRRRRSIARLRAVTVSQAPGLGGVPSRGQRSAAVANASWAASSARSKSPRKPTRLARTRPHSSRKTCSSSALPLDQRPHLDRAAHPRRRHPRGDVERRVEVVGLDEAEAAHVLLCVDERAVGEERLAVLDAHGRRGLDRLQLLAADDLRRPSDREVLLDDRLPRLLGHSLELLPGRRRVDLEQVLHLSPPSWDVLIPTTNVHIA